jgi:hypothetical protein
VAKAEARGVEVGSAKAETEAEKEVGAVGESAVAARAVAVREGSVVGARSAPRCKRRRRCRAQKAEGGK